MTFLRESSTDISGNNLEGTFGKLKPTYHYHMKTLNHCMVKMNSLEDVWEPDLSHDMMNLTCLCLSTAFITSLFQYNQSQIKIFS